MRFFEKNKMPVIFDVDTGIDDCVALAWALYSGKIDIKLIVCSSGNVGANQTAINTLNVLNQIRKNVPVAEGRYEPLKRKRNNVSVHGSDGAGDYCFPPHDLKKLDIDADQALVNVLNQSPEKVTYVAVGPCTNLALFIQRHPELLEKIDKVILMGGSSYQYSENETPYAGFNVKIDPEAAEIVINSKLNIIVCPMDMGHVAYLDYHDVFKVKKSNKTGEFFEKLFREYKDHHVTYGIAMHDSCCIAYLLDPKLFRTEMMNVSVKYFGEEKIGILVCNSKTEPKNFPVCVALDIKKFKKLFFKILDRMP